MPSGRSSGYDAVPRCVLCGLPMPSKRPNARFCDRCYEVVERERQQRYKKKFSH